MKAQLIIRDQRVFADGLLNDFEADVVALRGGPI